MIIIILFLLSGCSGTITEFYLNKEEGVILKESRPIAVIKSNTASKSRMVADGMEFETDCKKPPLFIDVAKLYAVKELEKN